MPRILFFRDKAKRNFIILKHFVWFQDLEIAADFNIAVPIRELLLRLKDSGHINVSNLIVNEFLCLSVSILADNGI